jgi:hypothetical protein
MLFYIGLERLIFSFFFLLSSAVPPEGVRFHGFIYFFLSFVGLLLAFFISALGAGRARRTRLVWSRAIPIPSFTYEFILYDFFFRNYSCANWSPQSHGGTTRHHRRHDTRFARCVHVPTNQTNCTVVPCHVYCTTPDVEVQPKLFRWRTQCWVPSRRHWHPKLPPHFTSKRA